jgi:hypothetical protein
VVLPVEEYRALREKALPPASPPSSPPVDATLTRVDYDLRLDAGAVVGRALLTIDLLREGWTRVQIPAGLMVQDARLDGQPVSLVEGPPPHVLLTRLGRSVLTLDFVVPLATAAGTESFTLPASAAPIARAAFVLPKSGVDLSLTGGVITDRVETTTESRWTAFGRPNQPLAFSWKRKVDDRRAELPLRVRGRLTQLVGLGEEVCQVTAAVQAEVLQGLARDIVLSLPEGLVINQVNGSTVADWSASRTELRVELLEPTDAEISFVLQGEMRLPRDGMITVPLVRIPGAEREAGGVAVEPLGAAQLAGRQARGLDPTDPSELGEMVAARESPAMVAFRLRPLRGNEPRSLTVDVVRYTPQAVLVANVEEARYRALASEDGRVLVEARYAVRNNQRSFLKVTLPPGSTVWSAAIAGRPVRPGMAEQDAVLVPLDKGRASEDAPTFVVQLVYLQRGEAWPARGRTRIDLPALDLPISRTGFALHHSPRFRVELQPGSFRLEKDPGPSAEALLRPAARLDKSALERESRVGTEFRDLVNRYRNEAGGRTVVGSLPVEVSFPSFGSTIYLASELTAEARAPSINLQFKRIR